jgi:hypothetical protein
MARYTTSGTVTTLPAINAELEKIQESIAELFSREGESPNQMLSTVDMNSQRMINLPAPVLQSEPVRLQDLITDRDIVADVITDRQGRGIFDITDYGAVPDGNEDNKVAIDAAISALSSAGGGTLYIPKGVFRTSGSHDVPSNMTVKGEGSSSVLKRVSSTTGAIFYYINPDRPNISRENVAFRDFKIEGVFDETGEEGSGNGVITLVGFRNIVIRGCYFEYIETFCLNINQCESCKVLHNDFRYIARDMVAVWGTPEIVVAFNTLIGGDDDCISLNQARFESTNGVMRDGLIVTGNYLRDTGSIKIQHAKNTIISNNVLKLCKGTRGIYIDGAGEAQGQTDARQSNVHNIVIESNIILDMLERTLAYTDVGVGSSNNRIAIAVGSKPRTTTEKDDPYLYHYSDSGVSDNLPVNEPLNILIKDNIVSRTFVGTGQTYEDLGFGKMFSRFQNSSLDTDSSYFDNGFVNPTLNDNFFQTRSLEVRDGLVNSLIEGNLFQGSGLVNVLFTDDLIPVLDTQDPPQLILDGDGQPQANFVLKNVIFRNNVVRNFASNGINLDAYELTSQDILIENNVIDGDPFFLDTSRNADGSWSSRTGCVGIEAKNSKGIKIVENTFKNLSLPWSTAGGSNENYIFRKNSFVGDPAEGAPSNDYDAGNKGIGSYPAIYIDPEMELIWEDSDPTSATYGQVKGKQDFINAGTTPSQGFYFEGYTLWSRRAIVDTGKILLGWRRMTTGSSHVSGTDWQPLYASIT